MAAPCLPSLLTQEAYVLRVHMPTGLPTVAPTQESSQGPALKRSYELTQAPRLGHQSAHSLSHLPGRQPLGSYTWCRQAAKAIYAPCMLASASPAFPMVEGKAGPHTPSSCTEAPHSPGPGVLSLSFLCKPLQGLTAPRSLRTKTTRMLSQSSTSEGTCSVPVLSRLPGNGLHL